MKVLAIVLALAAAGAISFRSTYEADLFWHLAQGREAAAGHIVRTNLFSYTAPDYPQPYTGWLFDLGLYWCWQIGGAGLVQAVQGALIAAAIVIVGLACRLRSSSTAGVVFAVMAWLVIEPRAIPRPHVFSFAGLAACAWLIERTIADRRADRLWWAVPLIALWSNVHVESVFGVALLVLFAALEWVRPSSLTRAEAARAIGIVAAAALAMLLNPYGIGILRYLYENTAVPSLLNIAELQAPYLPNYRGFFAYAAAAGLLAAIRWRTLALWEIAVLLVFGWLGFRYLRFTPMAAIATAAIAARGLEALLEKGIDRRAAIVTAIAAAVFLSRIPVTSLPSTIKVGGDALTPPGFFSEEAMTFARSHQLRGNVYVSNNIGGFVTWSLYPEARVFQDSRLQAYPQDHFRRMLTAWGSDQAWSAMVADVDWAVLSRPRVNELSGTGRFKEPEWAIVFRDEAIDIAVRRTGAYGRLAAAPVKP